MKNMYLIEGYSKQLEDLEMKIKGTIRQHLSANETEETSIQINDIVAVFMIDWHKWVRAVVKDIDGNGSFYVWLIDYGLPMLSTPSKTIKLPPMYTKMNGRYPRVHLGGLANCIPTESKYDVDEDRMVSFEPQNWSPNAIAVAQDVIRRAVQLKFEDYEEIKIANRLHTFGSLKIQKADGSWINLADCLTKALVAKMTTTNWAKHVISLDTVKQKEWMTTEGVALCVHFEVSPITRTAIPMNEMNQTNALTVQKKGSPVEQMDNSEKAADDQKSQCDKNETARAVRPFRRSSSINRSIRGVPLDQQPFRGMKFNSHRSRHYDRNDFSSEFPHGWHSNGRLNNRSYREEVEFFESGFRKPTKPVKKVESSSEGAVDEKNDNETTKSTENATTEAIETGTNANENNLQITLIGETSTENQTMKMKPIEVELSTNVVVSEQHDNTEGTKPNAKPKSIVDANNSAVNTTAMAQSRIHNENSSDSKGEEIKVNANAEHTKTAL